MNKVTRPGIEDTSARDPLHHFIGMLDGGQSAYIEGMEAAGQRQLVESQDLPSKFNDYDLDGPQSAYEALGFTFGEPHEHDPMFRPATLPAGWKREGSEHAMWSYIVDELGRRRVSIFYKAAFYDRDAFMSLNTVHGYVSQMRYEGKQPLLDDVWCTAAAVTVSARSIIKHCNETLSLYAGQASEYAEERLRDARKEIAWAEALIKQVSA